jgi:thioredoxin reductase
MLYDVAIVGGSYAGMAAAIQIARARRKVLVVDGGMRRNRFADSSHGFLGQDGQSPSDIADNARAQLMKYPNVSWLKAQAKQAHRDGECFTLSADDGQTLEAKRLVLATGVVDDLPEIPGLQDRWGKSVFHCPYCHGYELNNGRIGVIGATAFTMHQAMLVPDWGHTILFTNALFEPDADQKERLASRGVTIETRLVREITGRADVHLEDGRVVVLDGLFTLPRIRPSSPLAEQLGCAMEEGPLGPFIQTDVTKKTTVPGVFACGDVARAAGSVSLAVGDGAIAGTAAHQSLIFG